MTQFITLEAAKQEGLYLLMGPFTHTLLMLKGLQSSKFTVTGSGVTGLSGRKRQKGGPVTEKQPKLRDFGLTQI